MIKIFLIIMILLTNEAYAKIYGYEKSQHTDQCNPVMLPEKEFDLNNYWYEDESTLIEVIE